MVDKKPQSFWQYGLDNLHQRVSGGRVIGYMQPMEGMRWFWPIYTAAELPHTLDENTSVRFFLRRIYALSASERQD